MEEKEVDLPANDTENRKTQIISLLELGFCNREVAEQTGIPMGTVSYCAAAWRKKHKGEKLKKSKKEKQRAESAKESPKVDNSDRHLCKSCKFRSNRPEVNNCDYVAITKHSRGCKVEECTKYENPDTEMLDSIQENGSDKLEEFEEANISQKSIIFTSTSRLGLNIDSKAVKESLDEVGNIQKDLPVEKATRNGYVKVEATGRNGITRSTEDHEPVRKHIKRMTEFVKACEEIIRNTI